MKFGKNQVLLAGLAATLVLALGLLAWQYREHVTRENFEALIERFAAMGPVIFFALMAILPLFWAPLSPFLLLAPAFGTPTAIVGTVLALFVNMTISWIVSGKWFRPFFARLVTRYGYSIPTLSEGDMLATAILLRITPGVPFPLQNYLLGLAGMPLGKYLLVSVPIMSVVSVSLILFGEAIMKGNMGMAMLAVAVAVAIAITVRFLRARFRAKAVVGDGGDGAI